MRFDNTEILISNNANQHKTLSHIDRIAQQGAMHPFVLDSVKKYNLKDDLESIKKIFDAGFKIATFYPDPQGQQYIRTLNRFLKDQRANCVDYTVFISSFLRAIKVPHIIRMVSFDPKNPKGYQHIYPLKLNGLVLDLVNGQDQSGGESLKKPEERQSFFNKEVPYINKFDKLIRA